MARVAPSYPPYRSITVEMGMFSSIELKQTIASMVNMLEPEKPMQPKRARLKIASPVLLTLKLENERCHGLTVISPGHSGNCSSAEGG